VGLADAEELEAREARGRRVAELIQKEIAMADAAPKERVAGLVDVMDESGSLCYIDDDTIRPEKSPDVPLPQPQCETVVNLSEGSGAKARDLIDLDAPEVEASAALASRSPPPVSRDFDMVAAKPTEAVVPENFFFEQQNRGATPPGNRKHILTEEIKVNLQREGTNALPNQRLGN
jgi:hypothetical protein